jgi:acetylornithine deacetylase
MDSSIALLRDLVATPSVNPSLVAGGAGEAAIASLVADHLRQSGFAVEVDEVARGRPNVVGIAEGREPGPTLLLCGHTDTVGVDGMGEPFDPVIRDGRLYGRGAQDMKGGLAAMMAAADAVVRRAALARGRLIVAAVVDEEYASIGADRVAAAYRADAALIAEPTDMALGIAHKGFSCAEVTMHGRAAHGSRPREGRDAILRMGRLLGALERFDRDLQGRKPHALLGTGSLHASAIHGGGELSSYPARCVLQLERRTLPDEPTDAALREVDEMIRALRAGDPEIEAETRLLLARPAYGIAENSRVVSGVLRAAREVGVDAPRVGLTFWTDAAIFGAAGTPTVIFGPRGEGLHGVEEYVQIDDVIACQRVFERWILQELS